MELRLKNRTVLVMAGSRGIGLACTRAFADAGANVAICARDKDRLDLAVSTVPGALAIVADVSNAQDIVRAAAATEARFGGVDVLVVNAGGPPPGDFDVLGDADWSSAVDLTLMSAVRAARAVLPGMRARRWGRIVIISSYGVKQPVPGLTLSNSVRMAVLGWAKILARQVAADNVLVNTVCPGWTATERVDALAAERARAEGSDPEQVLAAFAATIPLGRLGKPEEIANLVLFLGSEAASYITGAAIQIDGGLVEGYA